MMQRDDVLAFATAAAVPGVTEDDMLLARVLEAEGTSVVPAVWDDPAVEWSRFSAVVIRSCWDYHLKHEQFLAWVDRVASLGVRVFNPPSLVRWNSEKTYLRDLAGRGVAVAPTRWVGQGEHVSLAELVRECGWDAVVVKPAVSASAHETWRSGRSPADGDDERFRRMVDRGRVLVQPFLDEVQLEGEWSLLFYGGAYSHAVLKRPRKGDFRVQREHGGQSEPRVAPCDAIAAASTAVRAATGVAAYATTVTAGAQRAR
ncbi:MAG: hypothetical protein ABJA80_11370, partial [bacterium]